MADSTPTLAAHTPLQVPRDTAASDSVFKVAAPWNFLPNQTNLFSSLAEFGAPQPTADYEKKVFEWLPPTPAGDHQTTPTGAWESPSPAAGLLRPQPQKPENGAALPAPSPRSASRSESPIDVVSTSAFSSVDQTSHAKDADAEIVRPQPLRVDSMDASVNPLLILASEQQQQLQPQPIVTLASAFGIPADTVIMSTEPGPSSSAPSEQPSSQSNNVSPPSRGCYTRAPGLGPPPETPTSGNGTASAYVCAVCGFSCASKFHYNSHMNTHGDHQCTMCDYTSRTEGRLKKHMRESHTVEQQIAAGLEVPETHQSSSSTNNSPSKDDGVALPSTDADMSEGTLDIGPSTLSSTLLGMIATSQASQMTSALEQMRAITEQPLLGDGSNEGLLLVGAPLGFVPMKEEGGGGGGGRRKQKVYKCKQCPHLSQTKEDQWAHARSHIPSDKQMSCDKCNFVTEYKHHLEYHQRNHAGIKPFQCKKCAYTCVNKSMLNSHMKSHSNVYQFRCADCNYATKYCHSLKLHLKKYGHRRNTEGMSEADLLQSLSAENSPPSMRKDSTASMSSSLSGPFTPFSALMKREEPTTPLTTPTMPNFGLAQSIPTSQSLSFATQMLLRQHQLQQLMQEPSHKCCMCEFTCGSKEEMLHHNMSHLPQLLSNSNLYQALGVQATLAIPDRSAEDDHHTTTGSPSGDDAVSHSNGSAGSPLGSGRGSSDEGEGGASRRKSKPSRIAIDDIGLQLMDKASPDHTNVSVIKTVEVKQEEPMDTADEPSATVELNSSSEQLVLPLPAPQPLRHQLLQLQQQHPLLLQAQHQEMNGGMPESGALRQAFLNHLMNQHRQQPAELYRYECRHCSMGYSDTNMHRVHMSYHSLDNPLQCSRCGMVCASALHFNLHLLQSNHL
ncbi:hbl-1 [Pristionchus pacificus]|uniref:Hbl-1 n=1 Tax=Pristionchus pacificus TaxID=54126 RepID=A0A2A6BF15_PRIPA|nr:hbl-1 [Pristionchus pacificus]|eukprot:PDM64453.1 hbl-1 [Pristionchus pacificus]